jgi:hypothetical protein
MSLSHFLGGLLVAAVVLAALASGASSSAWSVKAHSAAATPYTMCSDNAPGARFQLTNLTFAPDPLTMGHHLKAALDGVLGE